MKIRIVYKKWYTPPFGKAGGVTIYPFVFIRRGTSVQLLRHELIHVWQVKLRGRWKFYTKYLFKKSFREIMENMAYKYQADPTFLPPHYEKLIHKTLVGKLHK